MDDIDQFLQTLHARLLPLLEQVTIKDPVPENSSQVVEEILEDWQRFAQGRKLRVPMLRERTFWFALYQLEQLASLHREGVVLPFQDSMQASLITITGLLKARDDLPEGYFATRPGEEADELDDDLLLEAEMWDIDDASLRPLSSSSA